ncbi:MAG: hypothetical protein R3E75_01260 [Steroidobacteraceae bacterium]|nr:hypothetical protein [Nevskiaceae bacterium]
MLDPDLYLTLVTLHVVLFAYWLGGDWGVYICSRFIARPDLPVPERLRFLDALMRIDVLPRTAIVLLPVVGLHLAAIRGSLPLSSTAVAVTWLIGLAWLVLVWVLFLRRGTPFADRFVRWDIGFRVLLIIVLGSVAVLSLLQGAPVREPWIAAKLLIYATLLGVGLWLRTVIRSWRLGFQRMRDGEDAAATAALFSASIKRGRRVAWLFWTLIVVMAWLGINQPS